MEEELEEIGFEKAEPDPGAPELGNKLRFCVQEVRGGEVLAQDEEGKFTREVKDRGGLSLGMALVVPTLFGWVQAEITELNPDKGLGIAVSGGLHCLLEHEDGRGWICASCYNPVALEKVEFKCEAADRKTHGGEPGEAS